MFHPNQSGSIILPFACIAAKQCLISDNQRIKNYDKAFSGFLPVGVSIYIFIRICICLYLLTWTGTFSFLPVGEWKYVSTWLLASVVVCALPHPKMRKWISNGGGLCHKAGNCI